METQHHEPIAEATPEPQIPPNEQRYRRHLEDACEHLDHVQNWLVEAERADDSLERAREAYDARVKALIQNDPEALEAERYLNDRVNYSSVAQKKLATHKEAAKDSFVAAYVAKPDAGKQMLDGRVSISIRRSSVVHWDPKAAAREGKALVEKNPLFFDTLFAPIKQGFKKLISMSIPVSDDVMRIHPSTVVSFHGGDEMLRNFRNPFVHDKPE